MHGSSLYEARKSKSRSSRDPEKGTVFSLFSFSLMFLSCSCLFDVRAISAVILFLFDVRARSAVVPPPLLARVRGTKCRRASPSHRLLRCGSDAHLLKKPIGLRQEPAALSRQVSMGAQPFQANMCHTRPSHSSGSGGARWYWLRSAPAHPPSQQPIRDNALPIRASPAH